MTDEYPTSDERLDRIGRDTDRTLLESAIKPLRDTVIIKAAHQGAPAEGGPANRPLVDARHVYVLTDAMTRRLDNLEQAVVRLESAERARERRWGIGWRGLLFAGALAVVLYLLVFVWAVATRPPGV